MNKVILMGRLVRDPEVRYTAGAEPMAVARYTLAVNRRFRKQGEAEADFIGCVAFGKSGEFAEKYFRKGQLVSVVGRVQVRNWDDNDGKKHWATDIVIEEQYFTGAARNAGGEADFAKQSTDHGGKKEGGQASAPRESGGQAPSDGFYPVDEGAENDDLPF